MHYNLQRYLYDCIVVKHLEKELKALTEQFGSCRWAVRLAVAHQDEIRTIRDRMEAYENKPDNRGG